MAKSNHARAGRDGRRASSGPRARLLAASALVAAATFPATTARAVVYVYTPPGGTNLWSTGAGWAGGTVPVSAADARPQYATSGTVFAAGLADVSSNDLPGQFQAYVFDLLGSGPATGAAAAITINTTGAATGFTFVPNPANANQSFINLSANAGAGGGLTYNLDAPLSISSSFVLQGAGTATFNLNGVISGTGKISKTGTSAAVLNGQSTFTGGVDVATGGNVRIGADAVGSPGAIVSGPLGTGTLTFTSGGGITSRDANARVILNPLVDQAPQVNLGATTTFTGALAVNGSFTLSGTTAGNRQLNVFVPTTLNVPLNESGASFNLVKTQAGTLTLTQDSGYTGTTTVNAGVLQFNTPGGVGGTGANLTVVAGAAAAGFPATQANFISRINAASAGTVALAANTSSDLDLSALTGVTFGAVGSATYSGNLTPAAGTFKFGGGGGTLTLAGPLAGANAVTANTGVTAVLAAANTYTGDTTVNNGGVLRLANNGAVASSANLTVVSGGRMELAGGTTISGKTITINGNGTNSLGALNGVTGNSEWAGPVILGSGVGTAAARLGVGSTNAFLTVSGVVDDGAGAFDLNIRNADGSTGTGGVILTAANTYKGATGVVTGTLKLDGGDNRLPVGTTVTIGLNGNTIAQLDLNGRKQQVAGIARAGAAANNTITNTKAATASVLTVSSDSAASTFAGVLTDTRSTNGATLALTKAGASLLTLSAANAYAGGTSITGGTLAGTIDGALGLGNVSLSTGTTLTLSGGATNNYVADPASLLLANGSTVNLNYTGTDQVTALSADGGGTFLAAGVYGGSASGVPAGNVLSQLAGTGTITVAPVPEPATAGLLGLAAVGLLARRRRSPKLV